MYHFYFLWLPAVGKILINQIIIISNKKSVFSTFITLGTWGELGSPQSGCWLPVWDVPPDSAVGLLS